MRVWRAEKTDDDFAGQVALKFRLSKVVAGLLAGCGFSGIDEVTRFLDPSLASMTDPFEMPGMDRAVRRIWTAIAEREVMAVYGDYDADGMTSVALLVSVIAGLGGIAEPWLPVRGQEGYGLGVASLTRLLASVKPSLVITVDCGTNSTDAANMLSDVGVDLIITDHHEVSSELADAIALLNPKLGGDEAIKMLAGVGVAFKLCHALVKYGRQHGLENAENVDLRDYLDLAAVGTVADIVPLTGENRILVRHGIERLNRTKSPGLRALLDVAGVNKTVEASQIGFSIGPRLNAAGRLGEPEAALQLLLSQDYETARTLAVRLNDLNRTRKKIENDIFTEAAKRIDASFNETTDFGIVVYNDDWHQGVIGIVASRLASRYSRPVVVVSFDSGGVGRGSCRSIDGYSILKGLAACSDLLENYGGHDMAAGLDVRAENLEAFAERFNKEAASCLRDNDLTPVLKINMWLQLDDINSGLLDDLAVLKPFGQGNPVPVWAVSGVRLSGQCAKVGTNHLKFSVTDGNIRHEAIAFGMADRSLPPDRFDLAFTLQKNSFQGRDSIQLNVRDFRETPSS